ncbi:hypothetical protein L7F22_064987 [Adiantum nelumboides]|nr:hypothetical protein [Adiantum nelumboides]
MRSPHPTSSLIALLCPLSSGRTALCREVPVAMLYALISLLSSMQGLLWAPKFLPRSRIPASRVLKPHAPTSATLAACLTSAKCLAHNKRYSQPMTDPKRATCYGAIEHPQTAATRKQSLTQQTVATSHCSVNLGRNCSSPVEHPQVRERERERD